MWPRVLRGLSRSSRALSALGPAFVGKAGPFVVLESLDQSLFGVSRRSEPPLPPLEPPPKLPKLPMAPERPLRASPISLGTIQSLFASPSAILGSIWRYWYDRSFWSGSPA